MLLSDGYTEEEAEKMARTINNPVPWDDDEINRLYNQARRLYVYEKNRGNNAYRLFRLFFA